jgi:HEPN domain-containing protein
VNRKDLQELSNVRLKEAKALLGARLWDGSYYLAGYAVECALKACIAKQTQRYEFPDKERVIESYSHELLPLVRLAGLGDVLGERIRQDSKFKKNWEFSRAWSEESRYRRHDQESAQEMVEAVAHRSDGVVAWIRPYW